MAEFHVKNLGDPDEVVELPGLRDSRVDIGDFTVSRGAYEPGWRWSTHVRPTVGGEWCQARHVGLMVSGRFGVRFSDGATAEFVADDVYEIPPGHDGYVIGHEPVVVIEWAGVRAFTGYQTFAPNQRVLRTLLFTDIVSSSELAGELGDSAWRALLSGHFVAARDELERHGGREVKTTGDGLLATFDGAGQAIRCAAAIRRRAAADRLHIRAGVHVGEVELVGDDVRGIAVHEAQRISAAAGSGEILVSETTRALAQASGLVFDDRGSHALKGLQGDWHLYAYAEGGAPS